MLIEVASIRNLMSPSKFVGDWATRTSIEAIFFLKYISAASEVPKCNHKDSAIASTGVASQKIMATLATTPSELTGSHSVIP
jgi:hypothetical protein